MNKGSILQQLASKLRKSETIKAESESESESVAEIAEEHFDIINAAMMHDSTHWNNHGSKP